MNSFPHTVLEVFRSVSLTVRRLKLTIDLLKHSIHVLQIVMVQKPHSVILVILIKRYWE